MTWLILIISLIGLLVIIYLKRSLKPKTLNKTEYANHWKSIIAHLGNSEEYKAAIIEADKLLDNALKGSGMRGQTTSERLVSASRLLSAKDQVWQAHQLRNRVVHELGVKPSFEETKQALRGYGQALKDLGAF